MAIRRGDLFVATAWWTAILAKKLVDKKSSMYSQLKSDKYVYLIQDFEPGFYPWSARYALAESSYHSTESILPVFNTKILKEYFDLSGYGFNNSFVFEPVLNSGLRTFLCNNKNAIRERKILVYGRPSVSRNVFEIIVMALRSAVLQYNFEDWTFVSAGETHPDIDLGSGSSLVSLGKLSIDEYGKVLASTYAGISLMVSPHPSYPPLEMASFGVKVITNGYANKNLASVSNNICSVDVLSPDAVSEQLVLLAKLYGSENCCNNEHRSDYIQNFLSNTNPFQDIVPKIRNALN